MVRTGTAVTIGAMSAAIVLYGVVSLVRSGAQSGTLQTPPVADLAPAPVLTFVFTRPVVSFLHAIEGVVVEDSTIVARPTFERSSVGANAIRLNVTTSSGAALVYSGPLHWSRGEELDLPLPKIWLDQKHRRFLDRLTSRLYGIDVGPALDTRESTQSAREIADLLDLTNLASMLKDDTMTVGKLIASVEQASTNFIENRTATLALSELARVSWRIERVYDFHPQVNAAILPIGTTVRCAFVAPTR